MGSTPLSNTQKKMFRSIGHRLNPVVTIAAKGLTDSVLEEINRALEDHELIKVKLSCGDRRERQQICGQLCRELTAEPVQLVGGVALIYRASKQPKPRLSNLPR